MRGLPLLLVSVFSFICSVHGAKILSVFAYPGPSQYIFISPLLKALANKGHDVTSISIFPQKEPLKNFRDIPVMENANLFDNIMAASAEGTKGSFFDIFVGLARIGEQVSTNVLENSQVKDMMKTEKFDLIIVEIFTSEAMVGLGEFFNAPMVAVSSFGAVNFMDYLVGNPTPLSYIPHMSLPYDNHMTLMQRMANVGMQVLDDICFNYLMLPYQERVYKKYFPAASMTLNEARKNVSLVLLNDHFSLRSSRPYITNMVEVGGLHINQQPDPLTEDLQKFLDDATEGVIYFSLGSNVKSKDLPEATLKTILDTFRELQLKVLWKFEKDDLPNRPDNVFIKKWLPQPSILAHPNVKLFISHGGLLSTSETVFHGKPILGLPVIGDQFMNVKYAVKAGFALSLNIGEVTQESLKTSILELWTNPRYAQAVQRLSKKFKDRPLTPLETAIYWIEYVLRHDGAPHLRNAGQDLNFIQYHNIDVYAILIGVFVALVFVLIGIVKKLFCKIVRVSKESNGTKVKLN